MASLQAPVISSALQGLGRSPQAARTWETQADSVPTLLRLAAALLRETKPTQQDLALLPEGGRRVGAKALTELRKQIRTGGDPLGARYCQLRNSEQRRPSGQTFTPEAVVQGMVDWAAGRSSDYVRIVDAGAGSGRFTFAALARFPKAHAVCIEADHALALILRANAEVLGFGQRVTVIVDDFRRCELPSVSGKTLFIGNPPYARHHGISGEWKQWYSQKLRAMGHHSSQLAGLHLHFFLKTLELAKPGDEGCYITAAEWMDVNYGQALRDLLCNGLGGRAVFAVAPELKVFDDALVSAAITCFSPGRKAMAMTFKRLTQVAELGQLAGGVKVRLADAKANPKWSELMDSLQATEELGFVPLGDLFKVQRGQVTGANKVWVVPLTAPQLPGRFLFPCVTKATDLTSLNDVKLTDASRLRSVADLPASLAGLTETERKQVEAFLEWAEKNGAADGYIAQHRAPWWKTNLKAPAPIVMTYMGRRPPVFVLNTACARLINVAHGLYPKQPLPVKYLEKLTVWLNNNVSISSGRSYAGGLVKFEPSEAMRLRIPSVSTLLQDKI